MKNLRALFHSRTLARGSTDTRYTLAEACLIGLVSAFAALLLKEGIGWLGAYRISAAHQFGEKFVLPLAGLIGGMLAGWCLEYMSPAAGGGGIPQVKAVLAQFPIPLSLRVAAVKTIGTIFILGSGFTLGRRGPTVHVGAALAAELSRWLPTSPEHRRQTIAAGAAAGLAAGFNTPIAGVLFVVEELMRDVSNLTLETAILASFTGAVVSRMLGSVGLNLDNTILQSQTASFSAPEIPFYLLLGIIAGIFGGLFNRGVLFSLAFNRRLSLSKAMSIGLAGLISGSIVAFLPDFFRDNAGLREFLLAGELDWQATAIAFIAHFGLTLLAYGSGAPGGLFAPALVLGSSLGYLLGTGAMFLTGDGSTYTYALAGMGAFFTAVVRVPVTAIVIVFEITTDFNLVLPLMISCAVAYIVAESVSPGSLYQHLLENSGIQLDEDVPPNKDYLLDLKAAEVMQADVETLDSQLSLADVVQAMGRSHHRGFPVVEENKLVGMVTQGDLERLAGMADNTPLKQFMTQRPLTVNASASLSEVLYLLNRYQLSRLPVMEGNQLKGIITRSDIIRAEAIRLGGQIALPKPQPSSLIYQTRVPTKSKGKILIPLANPHTVTVLLKIGAAIARHQEYEIECLQIIRAPKHDVSPQTDFHALKSRKLLHQVERLGRKWQIPIQTQIRLAQDLSQTILNTISQLKIDIILMGWRGNTSTPKHIFGNLVDTIIDKADCHVVLVKPSKNSHCYPHQSSVKTKWLIPIAGGPNSRRAIELLPSFLALANNHWQDYSLVEISLCQVYTPSLPKYDSTVLEQAKKLLQETIQVEAITISICSDSVSEAIIDLVNNQGYDVVMLGASREGLLQQTIGGNIPEAIARKLGCTVLLVRSAFQ